MDFGLYTTYWRDLLAGVITTLELALLSLVLGTLVALLAALLRMSRHWWLRLPTRVYIDFFRTTPLLVQILWAFFVLPSVIHVDITIFEASVLAIGLNTGAFLAELYRGAIKSVPRGQWDAARALGLSKTASFVSIILPQAFRVALPPYTATAMLTLKGTSLAAVVGVLELTQRGNLITEVTFKPIQVLTAVALIYFVLIYPISILSAALERRQGTAYKRTVT
jgi:polar amino acid transport system permease protein